MASTRDVIIQTERFEEAAAFYRDVLGFEVILDRPGLLGFETGSFTLYVERGSAPGAVFDFEFDDAAAVRQRLLEQGCTIVDDNPSVPRCYVRDPYGLVFNVAER
jgi:catechol 2,3-dioxygenase-like lactoylglutathione lyase family enzyme